LEDPAAIVGLHKNAELRKVQLRRISLGFQFQRFVFTQSVPDSRLAEKVLPLISELEGQIPELDEIDPTDDTAVDARRMVLLNEAKVYRELLHTIQTSLSNITNGLQNVAPLTDSDREIAVSLSTLDVPEKWKSYMNIKLKLNPWIAELDRRIEFFNAWIRRGPPTLVSLSVFSDPIAYITTLGYTFLANAAASHDVLEFNSEILAGQPSRTPDVGVYLTGMFFEGARWDPEARELAEPQDGVIFSPAPVIHIIPVTKCTQTSPRYFQCPVFAVLHSDSEVECRGPFLKPILSIPIPTTKSGDFWILRGASLLLTSDELGVSK
jgi:dynein heavy chain